MNQERIADQYYTAKEARDRLGLKENTFQTWIKTGKIQRVAIPGRKGLYRKADIDRKVQLIESTLFLDATNDLEIKCATPGDVDAEIHLAHLIYGRRVLQPEAQRARVGLVKANPECSWYLYDRDTLVASINIVPVDHEAIEQFKQGKRGWLFVGTDHIKQFEKTQSGQPLECIVIDLMTTPAVPPEKRSFYASALLKELSNTALKQWGARGVEISKIYTCGSTDDGRRLLRRNSRYFQELGEPVPNRVIFELDVPSSTDFKLLQPYKEAFSASQGL